MPKSNSDSNLSGLTRKGDPKFIQKSISLPLDIAQAGEKMAESQMRSFSSYIRVLIANDLKGTRFEEFLKKE